MTSKQPKPDLPLFSNQNPTTPSLVNFRETTHTTRTSPEITKTHPPENPHEDVPPPPVFISSKQRPTNQTPFFFQTKIESSHLFRQNPDPFSPFSFPTRQQKISPFPFPSIRVYMCFCRSFVSSKLH